MHTNLAVIEKSLTEEISPVLRRANELTVTNTADKEVAALELNAINALIKRVVDDFADPKKKAHEAWKAVVAQEKGHLEPLEEAKQTIREKIGQYDLEQKRLAEIAERKRIEEARRIHEEQLAEAQTMIDSLISTAADVDETIELINMELKRDDLTDIERQKLESQLNIELARRDDNQAAVEEAQARAEAPVFVVPDTPRAEPTKVKGASTRYEYVPEVVNKTTLLRAIAAGKVPETVIDINMGQLKRYVNMVKQAVPGVVCTEKAVVSGRAR
ncbi:MAG: hypothetical protein WDA41_10930 [Candidatus Neomarinimicrobiota bacterium]